MMAAGVAGYITKDETPDRLIEAIYRAAKGEKLFTEKQYARALSWRETAGNKCESLTERERDVLQLLEQGLNNSTIARLLGVSPKTIAQHITNILEKLGVNSRHEAVAWLHKHLSDNSEEIPGLLYPFSRAFTSSSNWNEFRRFL